MIRAAAVPATVSAILRRAERTAGGVAVDLGLYAVSAAFAGFTAVASTLPAHRAWGGLATLGYAAATLCALFQLVTRRHGVAARAVVTALTWCATALVPLLVQASQRAAGRTDRAQEEVTVVELAGQRLLDTGTPYLSRAAIGALPAGEQLLGYLPYQPGMALFGLPRALAGAAWWTDARVWFALATAGALAAALTALWDRPGTALVRAAQAATVLPICALTLATGGDDLPVLALCLLALAFTARRRLVAAGVAIGAAGALKLFAWPVAVVLLVYAATRGRRALASCAVPALGLPLVGLLPALAVDAGAVAENLIRYPLGQGLVASPAASPFPGHLIASAVPGGRAIAAGLLVLAAAAIGWSLLRRPPRDAAAVALVCAYGLTAAILLMPSTRFGYLLYPAAYLLWRPSLKCPAGDTPVPETQMESRAGAGRRTQRT